MPELKNPRHENFAQHYARFGNATQAYITAGYSETGANANAARLIALDSISQRIKELREIIAAGVVRLEITERNNRIQALQERWNAMRAVIQARAQDPAIAQVPGGETGLIVTREKVIGFGEAAHITVEYELDTGLLKELRAHEQQAAQEAGQWAEKREHTGADGGAIKIEADGNAVSLAEIMTPEELEALRARLKAD